MTQVFPEGITDDKIKKSIHNIKIEFHKEIEILKKIK